MKKLILTIILITVSLFSLAQCMKKFDISGRILDEYSKQPVISNTVIMRFGDDKMNVVLPDLICKTDIKGKFRFNDSIPCGDYLIEFLTNCRGGNCIITDFWGKISKFENEPLISIIPDFYIIQEDVSIDEYKLTKNDDSFVIFNTLGQRLLEEPLNTLYFKIWSSGKTEKLYKR